MEKEIKWKLDPSHSEVGFRVKHLMISNVKGSFRKFNAIVYTMNRDFTTARIDFWAESDSVDTGDQKRDTHLRGDEFFDSKKYPEVTFSSTHISQADRLGNHNMDGLLTIRGVQKPVHLLVGFGGIAKDSYGNEKAGFKVTGTLNRKDWGLTWNSKIDGGGLLLGDDVKIICEVELINVSQKDLVMQLEQSTNNKDHTELAY